MIKCKAEAFVASRVGVAIFHVGEMHRLNWSKNIQEETRLQLLYVCESAVAALNWLGRGSPNVVIMDAIFPDGSGRDIILEIQTRHPNCNIIVVSDSDDEHTVFRCIEAGATGYLLSNQVKTNIAQAILDLQFGGNPLSPKIARMMMKRARDQAYESLKRVGAETISPLTKRESAILELVAKGNSDKHIGKMLAISHLTAQTHVKNIYRKLNVCSRVEATIKARQLGLGVN